jgi:hypothetical protein
MKLNTPAKCLLVTLIAFLPAICRSEGDRSGHTLALVTSCTYRIGADDSKDQYRALGLYCAKKEAVALSAKYLVHQGLLENFGPKQKEIYCLATDEIQATITEEKYDRKTNTYFVKIKTEPKISDFIKAEIKDLELEKEELIFSWQEEMEQYVRAKIEPAQELSRAYRYIRKRQWRIAIIYLDHLAKKYSNWDEIYLAKAIGFYGMHDIGRMIKALETSCALGNQEACSDRAGLLQLHEQPQMK